jgi:hypothetical protein
MLQNCCAVMAAPRELEVGALHVTVREMAR